MGYHADLDLQRPYKGGPPVLLYRPGGHTVLIGDDSSFFWVLLSPAVDLAGVFAVYVAAFDAALRFDLKHGLI